MGPPVRQAGVVQGDQVSQQSPRRLPWHGGWHRLVCAHTPELWKRMRDVVFMVVGYARATSALRLGRFSCPLDGFQISTCGQRTREGVSQSPGGQMSLSPGSHCPHEGG